MKKDKVTPMVIGGALACVLLSTQGGIAATRLSAIGYGTTHPGLPDTSLVPRPRWPWAGWTGRTTGGKGR